VLPTWFNLGFGRSTKAWVIGMEMVGSSRKRLTGLYVCDYDS